MSGSIITFSSCKIHRILSRLVDLDRLLDAVEPGGLVHTVLDSPGPRRDQVGVVHGGGDGDAAGAAGVGVAQLVGQGLELVSAEAVIIPETAVVAGPRGALDALV